MHALARRANAMTQETRELGTNVNRWSAPTAVGTFVATVALTIVIFGAEFHALSSDAGQHYALIKALIDTNSFAFPDAPHLATGLTSYPSLSQYVAAKLGGLLGSGLLGMTRRPQFPLPFSISRCLQ